MNKDELKLWRDEILRASKIKKWLVVYDRIDSPTTIGLTQRQYESFSKIATEGKGEVRRVPLQNGNIVSTNFKLLIQNPEWRDPIEIARKIVFYKYQRDFSERRAQGQKITWKEYSKEKTPEAQQIKKQLLEVLEND